MAMRSMVPGMSPTLRGESCRTPSASFRRQPAVFWDVLFGAAKITRRYPARVGLPDDLLYGKERWFIEMFYPLLQSRRTHSSLAPGGRAHALEEADPDVAHLALPPGSSSP